jgi:hypothetical protein
MFAALTDHDAASIAIFTRYFISKLAKTTMPQSRVLLITRQHRTAEITALIGALILNATAGNIATRARSASLRSMEQRGPLPIR